MFIYERFFFVVDPSKHNYQPRLFELSSATGKFTASEVLCPSRSEPKLCPFPFLQEDLYTAKQPGAEAKHSCYKTAQGNRNVRRFARGIRNEWENFLRHRFLIINSKIICRVVYRRRLL